MARVTVDITFNRFPEIAAKLPAETSIEVRKAAFDVEANAKMRVRVDTGALKNSIQTHAQPGDVTAEVSTNLEYALAQEFGRTDLKNYGFTPYMTPAAEIVRPQFEAAMKQLLKRL